MRSLHKRAQNGSIVERSHPLIRIFNLRNYSMDLDEMWHQRSTLQKPCEIRFGLHEAQTQLELCSFSARRFAAKKVGML